MYHVRIWLLSSTLDSAEGGVWTLVGDSVAVSRGCVLLRDWVIELLCNF